jgi:hypothetical protein
MPPQQPDRLLDLFNEAFDFGAHGVSDPLIMPPWQWREGCSGARAKAQSARAFFGSDRIRTEALLLLLTRFLPANRYPPPDQSEGMLRSKTL